MGGYYDEIEIEDMTWDPAAKVFHYPCPCGDRFEISRAQLAECEDIATCPSCSLIIRVIYDPLDYEDYEPSEDEGDAASSVEDSEPAEEDDSTQKNTPAKPFTDFTNDIINAVRSLNITDDKGKDGVAESVQKDPIAKDDPGEMGLI